MSDANSTQLDLVNHPPHYRKHPSGVEAIYICEQLPYHLGQALKYVLRAPYKDSRKQDLLKAMWYLDRYQNPANHGSWEHMQRFVLANNDPLINLILSAEGDSEEFGFTAVEEALQILQALVDAADLR